MTIAGRRLELWVGLLAIAVGAAATVLPFKIGYLAAAGTVAALPALFVAAERRPLLMVSLFLGVQPLEGFEIPSPFGTVSPGILILAALLLARLPVFLHRAGRDARLRHLLIALILWLAIIYPTRSGYLGSGQSFRMTITMASFVAVFVVAASLDFGEATLRACAYGCFAALMMLAVAGIAVSEGWIGLPSRVDPARTIFGITSPFVRNYGFNIPFDAVSLLAPLPIAYFVARRRLLPVALMFLAFLLVFQGRGMILQVVVAVAIVATLATPALRALTIPAGVALVAFAYTKLATADAISTGLRSQSDTDAVKGVLREPFSFLVGHSENNVFVGAAHQIGYFGTSNNNAVHNLFLSNLVGGGWVAFGLIAFVYWTAIRTVWRRWCVEHDTPAASVLCATLLTLMAVGIEPVRADIVGSWLVLGLAVAVSGSQERVGVRDAVSRQVVTAS